MNYNKEELQVLINVLDAILDNRHYLRAGYTEMKSEVYGLFDDEVEALTKWREMFQGVYSSEKDSTLSIEKFYKILQLLNYSKLVNGTDFTFHIAEKDTIRGFVGSSLDEDKNNIVLEGHYLIATFESWEYFHRMDENFEVMNFEYIYLHMIDGTWKILIKVY